MEDDENAREEEKLALSAIYQDAFIPSLRDFSSFTITLPISESWSASMSITFPDDYPSKSPPLYSIKTFYRDNEQALLSVSEKETLQNKLLKMFADMNGQVIVYEWVEYLKLYFQEHMVNFETKISIQKKEEEEVQPNQSFSIIDNDNDTNGDTWSNPNIEKPEHEYQYEASKDSFTKSDSRSIGSESPIMPTIYHGSAVTEKRSVFIAHLAAVKSLHEVELVKTLLLQEKKISRATHNITAYRIQNGQGNIIMDNDDDGETNAGGRLAHLLHIVKAINVFVMVSRWYGGIKLGPDRFRLINSTARDLLQEHGYIKEVDGRKGKGHRK